MQRPPNAATEQPRIAVIGAGFAGLRCADVLLQHGFPVTIFEARDRVGGRVAQSHRLGNTVDLGPNWIHGAKENPILQIAKETGTELHYWDESEALFDPEGNLLDAEEAEEYGSLLWDDGLIAEAFEYSERNQKTIDPWRSVYDFFAEKAEGVFTDLEEDVAKRKREMLLLSTQMWGAYVGSPVQRQSLRFFFLEETVEGEDPFVAGTYARILEAVARPARERADVRLGCRVSRLITESDNKGQGGVTVETAGGEKEDFDEVIVTVPLGYLQRNRAMFEPPLPARMTAAISSLGYGNLDKVYVTFPSAFWNDALPKYKTATVPVGPNPTMPNVPATTPPAHESHRVRDTAAKPTFPGFANWLPPTYASSTNPERWDQQAMNLAALPQRTAHPTLLFYVYGPCATHIASLASSSTPDAALKAFFQPYIALLPNYSPTNPSCQPKAVLATAWKNDELAGYGSYSNFQVGLENGREDIEVLRQGCPERGIWFAGEHTAPLDAMGTTTGAYLSGERVAQRIIQTHDKRGSGGVRG